MVSPSAFRPCDACAGLGFHRRGAFGDRRTFHPCDACGGLGQVYLRPPPPPPPPDKRRPDPDPVNF